MNKFQHVLTTLLVISWLAGCTTAQTINYVGRPNDTMYITIGSHPELTAADVSITLNDHLGVPHPVVPRAVVNLYPDPLSNLIVERFYTENYFDFKSGLYWGTQLEQHVTNGDQDYSLTLVAFDIPDTTNPGLGTIDVTGPGLNPDPIDIEVLAEPGQSHNFKIQETLPSSPTLGVSFGGRLRLAERAPNNVVTFSGTLPQAIQIELSHDPDSSVGGNGLTYVTSTRADYKSLAWHDDGTNLKVLLLPATFSGPSAIDDMSDFKFYVAGGISGLSLVSLSAFDVHGNPVNDVTCQIDGTAC